MKGKNSNDTHNNDTAMNNELLMEGLGTLFSRPVLFPLLLDLDSRKIHFAVMDRLSYEQSNFLNVDRATTRGGVKIDLDWLLCKYLKNHCVPTSPHFIFHTAHCCSTLLTRCIYASFKSFVLREPHALYALICVMRDAISGGNGDVRQAMLRVLLFRRFSDDEPKHGDLCNVSMSELLTQSASAKALFLYSDIESFIISALKNAQRKKWLRMRFQYVIDDPSWPTKWNRLKVDVDKDATRVTVDNLLQVHAKDSRYSHSVALTTSTYKGVTR